MSTQPVSSTGSLSNLPGSPMAVTGLASGLDTNSIISSLIAVDQLPITNLQNQEKGISAEDTQLTSIQTALQGVALNAQALGDPTLFGLSQTVTSSQSAVVGATPTSSTGVGAVTGGYQVAVSALANAAQSTYTFNSPTAAETVTIDSTHTYNLAQGASIHDFANAVNSDQNGSVWAAITGNNTVVLSERATGSNGGALVSVNDPSGTTLALSGTAQAGQDAAFTINGGATQYSASNTTTTAIAGVSLTLSGITAGTNPVTVDVGAPAPSTSAIQAAVAAFVKSYNAVLDQISAQLTQKTSSTDPTQGTLFGDQDLEGLMNSMRTAMYTPDTTLPAGMAALSDIGVSTGAASGDAAPSQDAIEGKLTIDTNALAQALQSNPNGVAAVLQSWSVNLSQIVNDSAQAGGTLDIRIQGNTNEITDIGNRVTSMQANLAVKQQSLQTEYANMEVLLSQNQSTSSWLTSQVAGLTANSTVA